MKKIVLLAFLSFASFCFGQIKKIEPPFWWSNMKTSQIQVLLYGENISKYEVKSELPIENISKVENPNYLFVTFNTQGKEAKKHSISLWEKKKKKQTILYELKARRANSAERKGFDASDMIYLLMPDRFANGTPDNDSSPNRTEKANRKEPGARHGGDIQGIINNLDYIQSLGATAIWSTPMCEDNDATYSYHTYAQSDFYRIDSRYGTIDYY